MTQADIKIIDTSEVKYQHFDKDPDGDPDRAGDGIYFQLPGDENWSGVWHSQEEAEGQAWSDLDAREDKAISTEMEAAGYICVHSDDDTNRWVNKFDDRWFTIDVMYDCIYIKERFGAKSYSQLAVIEVTEEENKFGYRHKAAREALESVTRELENNPSPAF